MLTSLAHTAVCVPDVEEAVRWYESVLGLTVIWEPVLMENDDIQKDMGEVIPGPGPVAVKAAILGVGDAGASFDRVLEVIQYPHSPGRVKAADSVLTDHGYSHVGLLCDDLAATRADLESKGVQFLTEGLAEIVGLRTTWFEDPWRNVFILMEKRQPEKPYYGQY
jgi:catechol 2,3-dioxygenase-like lactoylglutathione lyase family enzyme